MILSMLVVCAVAAAVYVFIPHSSSSDPVKTVTYRTELATARRAAPYALLAPEGLPKDWRATSVWYDADDSGHATWHLGFITPAGTYAALEQSNASEADMVAEQVQDGKADGGTAVDGLHWDRYSGHPYRALVQAAGGATTMVTGSASYQELAQLAGALRK